MRTILKILRSMKNMVMEEAIAGLELWDDSDGIQVGDDGILSEINKEFFENFVRKVHEGDKGEFLIKRLLKIYILFYTI